MAEYFGDILASSRSDDASDDRGASWAALVSRLPTRQVHLHYLAYASLRSCLVGSTHLRLGLDSDQQQAQIYLPASALLAAMNLEISSDNFDKHVAQSMIALRSEDLFSPVYAMGARQHIETQIGIAVPDDGLVFTPSASGLHLFYWAHGMGNASIVDILDPEKSFTMEPEIQPVEGATSVAALREAKP
jgi:hypothetical protein